MEDFDFERIAKRQENEEYEFSESSSLVDVTAYHQVPDKIFRWEVTLKIFENEEIFWDNIWRNFF